jgi:hypothetical protein
MQNDIFRGRLKAPHTDEIRSFYESVFDWKLTSKTINGKDYYMIEPADGPGGDPTGSIENASTDNWIPFVTVSSVEETLSKAKQKGATIVEDRTQFGDQGYYGIFKDPEGAVLGVWETP